MKAGSIAPLGDTCRFVSFESLEITSLAPRDARVLAACAAHEVRIAVGQATIAVRFSRQSAAFAFAERFADLLGQKEPDVTVFAVARPGETLFWLSADSVRRWPQDISDDLLVFFADGVAFYEYFARSNDIGLHAAVIACGPRIAALVGKSTAGKTTTAIAATRAGFRFYSDERCIIQAGKVVPFLRAITIREGGRAALLDGSARGEITDAMRSCSPHGDVVLRPRALFGDRAGGPPGFLRCVFIITARGDVPAVNACRSYAGMPAMLRSMVSRETGIARAARLMRELRDVPIFEVRLGTPEATVAAIERTLNETLPGGSC